MQEKVKKEFSKYIKSLNDEFEEIHGGSFAYLSTGEIFTKAEVQKYIQKKIEQYSIDNLSELKKISKDITGVDVEQRLVNNRSKKPDKKLKNKGTYDGGNFNIVYHSKLEDVMGMKLNSNEKLVYYVLRDYAQYPTNCIVIKDHIPTMTELEPIVGLSERSIRESLKSLEDKGLIKLKQSGHRKAIYINPEYYATGKELDTITLQMFNLIQCNDEKVNEYLNKE
jgi:DNA-binding transcriptional ArsR family regulator